MGNKSTSKKSPRGDSPEKSVDFLRKRLGQAELQLREMEAESKRLAQQQQRTIDVVLRENKEYLDRIEEIRMEECCEGLDLTEGLAAAKIIASRTPKYCQARDLVSSRRTACAEALATEASAQEELLDLKKRLYRVKKRAMDLNFLASAERIARENSAVRARDQLRNLELRFFREQECLSFLTTRAKEARIDIDKRLIEQAQFEKYYAASLNRLLDQRKEISFLTEVCQVLFEERDHQVWELRKVREIAERDRDQYERVFSEISAVLEENKRQKEEMEVKRSELQKSITEAQIERLGLEAEINKLRKPATPRDGWGNTDPSEGDAFDDPSNSLEAKLQEYKNLFDGLSDVTNVDTIKEVVNFPKELAEKRFSAFKEINLLEDSIRQLESTKKELLEGLMQVSTRSQEDMDRLKRMKALKKELVSINKKIDAENNNLANTNGAVTSLCSNIETLFRILGCNVEVLNRRTGMGTVVPATALAALCLVEQRTEDYLLALSRKQSFEGSDASVVDSKGKNLAGDKVARPIIRRPNLPPRSTTSIAKRLKGVDLPRTTDHITNQPNASYGSELTSELHLEDTRPLTLEEMKSIVSRRSRGMSMGGYRRDKHLQS